jgi:hypothetical protein
MDPGLAAPSDVHRNLRARPSLTARDVSAEREYERRVERVPATEAAAIAVEIGTSRRDGTEAGTAS